MCVCVFCLKRLGSLPNIHFDTENVDQPNQPSDALEFRSQDLQSETGSEMHDSLCGQSSVGPQQAGCLAMLGNAKRPW